MATQARNLFSHLPPPAEVLAILIGTAELTIFGLAGFANPSQWAKGFGLPTLLESRASSQKHPGAIENAPAEDKELTEVEKTQKALIAAVAARNIQHGILLLIAGVWTRDRRLLGITIMVGLVSTVTDYCAVNWYGVKEAAGGHLIGVANCLLVGGSLLFWRRDDPWW